MSRHARCSTSAVRPAVLLVAALIIGACGGGGGGGGGGNGPSRSIAKAGAPNGDGQTDTVHAVLAESLRVLVLEDGVAKSGVTVNWSTPSGGSVSPAASQTDANGVAATRWTLGQLSGGQAVNATLAGATGSPVTFAATANAGSPVSLVKTVGDNQLAQVNGPASVAPTVRVTDQFGNGVGGVSVSWSTVSGAITPASATTVTLSSGAASVVATAGATPGPAVLRASSAAVPGIDRDFAITVFAGARVVSVGNFFFRSTTNLSENPAVDTIHVGSVMRWDLSAGSHSVQSIGVSTFQSSQLLVAGTPYEAFFPATGTFQYECGVHGVTMPGTVVVIP